MQNNRSEFLLPIFPTSYLTFTYFFPVTCYDRAWTRYNCDSLVQAATDKVAQIVAVDNLDRSEAAAIAAAKLIAEKSRKKDKKKDKKKDSATPALPAVDKDNSGTSPVVYFLL